ncbi:MAG TPA: flagellar hook basal-body protein [Polyangia bacterium]|nr:flagellar hook basal-body protein [Polyangia bacterium]
MADGMYVGMAAAVARSEQLDSIADNLANAETPGYKASRPAFQSFLPSRGLAGARGAPQDKVFAAAVATGTDLSPGPVRTTDNPLDIIPEGQAFLSVGTQSGQVAYTRNGKLNLTPDGMLVADGRPVLGETGKPILIPPGAQVTINQSGVVSADQHVVDTLALFNLQGNIVRVGPQLYAAGPGGMVTPAEGGVSTGQLEMGNVTPLESTVQMINAQRQYETAMQAIQTYRRLDDRAIEVGKVR